MIEPKAWLLRWFESKGHVPGATEAEKLAADYFESGLIDSLAIVGLVGELERNYAIRFEDRHYREPRFSTIGGLAAIVGELAAAGRR
ncbi:MAG: hypothetical protein HY925_13365 [Elusimicrobia bacterium]|nr:hypothetical protein [Elusimicrobiota bacterium]